MLARAIWGSSAAPYEPLPITDGGIDFYGLRGAGRADDVSLWVFDLLELDGQDLRDLPRSRERAGAQSAIGAVWNRLGWTMRGSTNWSA